LYITLESGNYLQIVYFLFKFWEMKLTIVCFAL